MVVTLFINTSEKNVLNKRITQIGQYNCKIKDDCSVTNPTIILQNIPNANLAKFNYMYIDIFQRYYFIDSPVLLNNGLVEITGKTDVLMSFRNEIEECSGVLDRQENIFDAYLTDDEFFNENRTKTAFRVFATSMPEQKCFLYTV